MLRRAQLISTLVELVGMALVVGGLSFLSIPAAFIAAGCALGVIGYSLGVEVPK
jgi:hypothetical protein